MSDPYSSKPARADYVLRAGDTAPGFDQTLKRLDGSVRDLSSATSVRLYLERQADGSTIDTAAQITNAANGEVRAEFDGEFEATGPGMHAAYFDVEFDDGDSESYPRGTKLYVYVPESYEDVAFVLVETESTPDPIPVVHVASESDLTGNEEGWYVIDDSDEVVYWIP